MKKFAVFDIDGTLLRWQFYHVIVNRLAKSGKLGENVYRDIKTARLKWKNRENEASFRQYESTLVHRWLDGMAGVSYDDYLTAVNDVMKEYIGQVYTYTRDLARQLKADGYFLLTISGSPHEAITAVAAHYDFDDFAAAEFVLDDDRNFTGQINTPIDNKAEVLKKLVEKHGLTWAESIGVGDSGSDIVMLDLVEKPIAFNPDEKLFKAAQQNGWRIVVERKNVVYELSRKEKGGDYVLG